MSEVIALALQQQQQQTAMLQQLVKELTNQRSEPGFASRQVPCPPITGYIPMQQQQQTNVMRGLVPQPRQHHSRGPPHKRETEEAAATLAALSGARHLIFASPTIIQSLPIGSPICTRTWNGGNESGHESDGSEALSLLAKPIHAPPVSSMMVDHTYIDFSVIEEEELSLLDENKKSKQEEKITRIR